MNKLLFQIFERLFVFLLLLSSMNVIVALNPTSREQAQISIVSADVNTSSVLIESGVYAYGGILALMHWRRVLRAARAVWPLLALAGLACLSTTWSIQPMVTFRRSLSLLVATIIAIYVGQRYSIKEFGRLLAQTFCLMIMLVLIIYWAAPAYIISYSDGGAWKGLSAYKNAFGEHMAVALLLLLLVRFHRFSWLRYVFIPIAASLLMLSRSATAVVCGLLGIAAMPLWRLIRSKKRSLVYPLVALIFGLGIYCILAFPEPFFQILGRDATLSGRAQLWGILLPIIANRPILGYGYAAFWSGLQPEVLTVWIRSGWPVPAADNGYIDLCLSLGALGVCLFLYVLAKAFRNATEYINSERALISFWPITYLCVFAADSICESALLTRGTFPYLVFAILTTSLAINHKREVASARIVGSQPFTWRLAPPAI